MARVDDYQQARDLAAQELAEQSPDELAGHSGLAIAKNGGFNVTFLDKRYHITYPDFIFSDVYQPDIPIPLQEQVLILHYLQGSRPFLKDQWIAYREIPGASFYFGPFVKRAIEPLKKAFGQNVAGFKLAANRLGGHPIDTGNAAFIFSPLPFAPVQLVLWEGDDEFPAEANILFDASIGDYLAPEDAAWLASLVVYRLISLSR